jgi:hypothetical protein
MTCGDDARAVSALLALWQALCQHPALPGKDPMPPAPAPTAAAYRFVAVDE